MIHHPHLEETIAQTKAVSNWANIFFFSPSFMYWFNSITKPTEPIFTKQGPAHGAGAQTPSSKPLQQGGFIQTRTRNSFSVVKQYYIYFDETHTKVWNAGLSMRCQPKLVKTVFSFSHCELRVRPTGKNLRETNPWKKLFLDTFSMETGKKKNKKGR